MVMKPSHVFACLPLLAGTLSTVTTSAAPSVSATRRQAISLVKSAESAYYVADFARASALCERALAVDATYPRAYSWLGAIREKQNRLADARTSYARVLALAPQSADAARARVRLQALPQIIAPPIAATPTLSPVVPRVVLVRVLLDGQELNSGQISAFGRVLVPLRSIFEGLGAEVGFQDDGLITAKRADVEVRMRLNETEAFVNGRRVVLDEPPRAQNGQAFVPLRFVAEAFNAQVIFDASRALAEVRRSDVSTPKIAQLPPPAPQPQPQAPAPEPAPPAPVIPEASAPAPAPVIEPEPETLPAPAPDPDAVAAPTLVAGRVRTVVTTQVAGEDVYSAWALSKDDPDMTFDLKRRWNVFEVKIAMPDNAEGESTELRGWFDDLPALRAFAPLKIYRGRKPITLRLRLDNASHFTLSPGYPGHTLLLISPHFERMEN